MGKALGSQGPGRSCHLEVKEFSVSSAGRTGRNGRASAIERGSVQQDLREPHGAHSLPEWPLEAVTQEGRPRALSEETLSSAEMSPAPAARLLCGTSSLSYPTSTL